MNNDLGNSTDERSYRPKPPSIFSELPAPPGRVFIIFVVAILLIAGILWGFNSGFVKGDVQIQIYGDGVDQLEKDSLVVVGQKQVGKVIDVSLQKGEMVASLEIKKENALQIPSSSIFSVEPVNEWIPGNIGVRINTKGADEPLQDDMVFKTSDKYLPVEIPTNFYFLIIGAIIVILLMVVFVVVIRDWIRGAMIVAATAVVIAVGYAYFNGLIAAP